MPGRHGKSQIRKVVRIDPVTHEAVKRAARESGSAVGAWANDVLRKAADKPRLSIHQNHVEHVIDQALKSQSGMTTRERWKRKGRLRRFLSNLGLPVKPFNKLHAPRITW